MVCPFHRIQIILIVIPVVVIVAIVVVLSPVVIYVVVVVFRIGGSLLFLGVVVARDIFVIARINLGGLTV